ncbi:helicase-related protein [Paenibacillus physcomitrellae]|uniref:DNA/RNA helicase n=1 Tax=Paenibacillus physcomitrellae TaxID=1619311 RepID=A0ABQ1GHG7_9BACL|nr:helicase-related protein [Paenibacillus physcomitrellae]GGA43758.1 hypothetical protein GCM10010917_31320 [Paenibacillus physcomitrellae]
MKVSLYVARSNGKWSAYISLDLRVDLFWWTGGLPDQGARGNDLADQLILLGKNIPLGQAAAWRDHFVSNPRFDRFGWEDWASLMRAGGNSPTLSGLEKRQTPAAVTSEGYTKRSGRDNLLSCPLGLYNRRAGVHPQWRELCAPELDGAHGYAEPGRMPSAREVKRFAALTAGRSLLQPELRGLLDAQLPELAGSWRTLAQLAQLAGRAALMAAVAPAQAGRRRWFAGLLRGPALPRCRRCGSEVTRTAPCASCGQSSCAYCEACLAMGRSRSCALLLRGSAVSRAAAVCAAPQAPTDLQLDRWGLSPAQREAAAAALRFLAAPRTVPNVASPTGRPDVPSTASAAVVSPAMPPANPYTGPAAGSSAISSAIPSTGSSPAQPTTSPTILTASPSTGSKCAALPSPAPPARRSAVPGNPARFLLWAVTGAGKTEMIFPLLAYVLEAGGRALVATPRRDIVLELAPRLAKVFPEQKMSVLYGGSEDRWSQANLVLATTHQLLRFHKAFDLVIIDELDAFPYHNDPILAYAAEACCKDTGNFIFLSATPPKKLQRDVAAGRCGVAKVPARFHGYPLPVPKRIQFPGTAESIKRKGLPAGLITELKRSLQRDAQIFLFVSRIQQIPPMLALLQSKLPGVRIEGTSSQDGERSAKVMAFRSREIRILITTTILERGVTVPRSDVFILDADSGLFDEASLVQMAGRAGRSKEDPAGRVFLFSSQSTSAQRGAIRQIKQMNRIALSKGYLRAKGI